MVGIDGFLAPTSPSLAHVDLDALACAKLADDGPFPPSFRAYVRTAGWARLFGLWLVYPPVLPGFADGWPGRTSRLTERFRAVYADNRAEEFDWAIEPDGDWDLVDRLEVFAWSENGDLLLWELGARTDAGELPIWESRGMNSLHRLGDEFGEALPGLRERAGALGAGQRLDAEPLSGTLLEVES